MTLKLIHINYHCHHEFTNPMEVIAKHRLSSGFTGFIRHRLHFISVKHANCKGKYHLDWIDYFFFRSRNRFWYIPFATHRFIKKQRPDVILAEGFVFPLQLLALRLAVGRHCRIIAQHHGEKPFAGIKYFFQRLAGRATDAFIFTAFANAAAWTGKGIARQEKCFEVLSASTGMRLCNREICQKQTGMDGCPVFIWAGRLNANKDPLTVIKAFGKYHASHPKARLYMVFQDGQLLPEVEKLRQTLWLDEAITLLGKIDHDKMESFYSSADYFISGSHSEGSGYALVEAMCCGCIPVVTNIPSFKKITGDGKFGMLYEPGNAGQLSEKLNLLNTLPADHSNEIAAYAKKELSYQAVAEQLFQLCLHLTAK